MQERGMYHELGPPERRRRSDTLQTDNVTRDEPSIGHLPEPGLVQGVANPARDVMRADRELAQDIGRADIPKFFRNLIQELRQISQLHAVDLQYIHVHFPFSRYLTQSRPAVV